MESVESFVVNRGECMRNRIITIGTLISFFGILGAVEFRSPYLSERGPLRYIFEEKEEHDYSLKAWSTFNFKTSHKAFINHGIKTQPLSQLFFNQSEFRMREIFYNSDVPLTAEFYNPYIKVLKIKPRATYTEEGVTLGARFDYPVYKNKGRAGVRGNVPFRRIEIQRVDQKGRDTAQLQNVRIAQKQPIIPSGTYTGWAYRLDFVEALPVNAARDSIVIYYDGAGSKYLRFAAQEAATSAETLAAFAFVAMKEDHPPRQNVGVKQSELTSGNYVEGTTAISALQDDASVAYWIKQSNFTSWDESTIINVDSKLTLQANKAKMWLTGVHKDNGDYYSAATESAFGAIEDAIQSYNENIYEWLSDRGFVLEDSRVAGLGDVDLDFFYEHVLKDDVIFEVMLGCRLPTGGGDKYAGNAYRPRLGNGEHWELKLGAMVAWQPITWLNVKVDGYYSFVLEGREQLPAAFKGAKIKNMGPRADADIDWNYLVGRVDVNLFHPKTNDLSTSIGYELYYKTSDNINFKERTMESWLGRTWSDGALVANNQLLSNSLAEQNTQAIGHKLRGETSYRLSERFEIFAGGSYIFAGQNLPRELDAHIGFNTNF